MSDISEIKELLAATLAGFKRDSENAKLQMQILMDDNRRIKEDNQRLRDSIEALSRKVEDKGGDKLKKEVMNKFRRHKKEMIKHKIIETVRVKRMALPELKEFVVDQMDYCSKATFYRYYDELRKEGSITLQNKMIVSNVLSIV